MSKLLFIIAILLVTGTALIQHHSNKSITRYAQPAMMIAIDPVDGSFTRPSTQQRQALKSKQLTQTNQVDKFVYRDTLTVHSNGTKSGVVNPQFLHTILATRNADGEIVLHESKEPAADHQAMEMDY